jgi:hypothetical protein
MFALIRRILSYKFFPICWTLFIIFLLCLPGSLVPGTGIFAVPNIDKVVHVFLFGMNVLFWGWHYGESIAYPAKLRRIFILSVISTIILGIGLEYVQLYFIPNRSFDSGDIVADIVGSVLAGGWLLIRN